MFHLWYNDKNKYSAQRLDRQFSNQQHPLQLPCVYFIRVSFGVFFFFCSFLAGSVLKLYVSVHAGGCRENEISVCRAGPVVSVC